MLWRCGPLLNKLISYSPQTQTKAPQTQLSRGTHRLISPPPKAAHNHPMLRSSLGEDAGPGTGGTQRATKSTSGNTRTPPDMGAVRDVTAELDGPHVKVGNLGKQLDCRDVCLAHVEMCWPSVTGKMEKRKRKVRCSIRLLPAVRASGRKAIAAFPLDRRLSNVPECQGL